jgi:type I restriction enzyme, S subunit
MSYIFYKEKEFMSTSKYQYPKSWNCGRFDSIMTLEYGKGLIESTRREGQYPVFGSKGIVGYHDEKLVKGPGIVVGRKGTIGAVSLSKKDFWPIDTTFYVKIKSDEIDWNWLFYELVHLNLPNLTSADVVPGLKRELVHNLILAFPSLVEQQRIAKVLGVVDSALAIADRLVEKTERLKKGLMQQLLTHGIGHTEYKETPLGKMPQQWNVVKFRELILKLKRGPSKQTNNKENGVVYLTSDYITDNGFLKFENLKYLDENLVDDVNKYLIEKNDLIVNCVNSFEKIGKVAVFEGFSKRVAIGFNNFALTLEKSVDPFFLKYVLSQDLYKTIFQSIGKAAVQQVSFSSKDLFRVQVPMPPTILEQSKIAEILSFVDSKIQIEKNQKAKLERIKQGMMDLLLTGKIRIKVD